MSSVTAGAVLLVLGAVGLGESCGLLLAGRAVRVADATLLPGLLGRARWSVRLVALRLAPLAVAGSLLLVVLGVALR